MRIGYPRWKPVYLLLVFTLVIIAFQWCSQSAIQICEDTDQRGIVTTSGTSKEFVSENGSALTCESVSEIKLSPDIMSPHNSSRLLQYPINFSNIHEITLGKRLGFGVSKETYAGVFHSRPVAIKMVTPSVADIKACVKKLPLSRQNFKEKDEYNKLCYTFPNMKLMKEILLVSQLDHPGIIKLLGYCLRSEETVQTPHLDEHGIIAVYEKVKQIKSAHIKKLSVQSALTISLQLLDLLDYLEHSPLGSLAIMDLKYTNLMIADGHIKITDLDDVTSSVPKCGPTENCPFNVTCIKGLCPSENAVGNIVRTTNLYFQKLLKCDDCKENEFVNELAVLLQDMGKGAISAKEASVTLTHIQTMLSAKNQPGLEQD